MKKQIRRAPIPASSRPTLDGVNQIDYLTGKSDKSARDTFFYYSGKDPSAVRYKNWKFYFTDGVAITGGLCCRCDPLPLGSSHNIKRDPFETSVGDQPKTVLGHGRCARCAELPAYIYDWNMLPIGQSLWLKELESYIDFPPMQSPGKLQPRSGHQQIKEHEDGSHAGE